MNAKWGQVLGLGILTFALTSAAQADHWHGAGYPNYSGFRDYGSGPRYGYGGSGYSGYYPGSYSNRTEQYHYTHPRVTTGYGFQSYPTYRYGGSYSGYGHGGYGTRYRSYNGYRGGRGHYHHGHGGW